MPELPDVEAYLAGLRTHVLGQTLLRVRVRSVSLLRTYDPPLSDAEGRRLVDLRRLGKRLVLGLEDGLFLVIHLMVAGRLRWREQQAGIPARSGLAAFDFDDGTLVLTEAGTTHRASLHVVAGEAGLAAHDPGGLDPLDSDRERFAAALSARNRTLKRALTDQQVIAGIGNAYSDEILHRARMSPAQLTANLQPDEVDRLHATTVEVLGAWTRRLAAEAAGRFPERVTAFRPDFAVHGRYGKPCPDCGSPVQRIRYADNETNYCARCQTGGRVLKDRALSRLLKDDWPPSLDEAGG